LSFRTRALDYLTESAFPVYLLHQSAIVVPGYFLIRLSLGLWTKFVLLVVLSSVLSIAVYHLLVRPFALPRFLCGMKPRAHTLRPRLAAGLTTATLALLVLAAVVRAASTPQPGRPLLDPVGRWHAEGGAAQVEIHRCGAALCGEVVWLRAPFDENGCPLLDRYNPEDSLRQRPVVGLEILRGLVPAAGDASWGDGTIYDPGSGRTYRASMNLLGPDQLELRGYVGIPLIGRTTRWFRVGAEQALCAQADAAAER